MIAVAIATQLQKVGALNEIDDGEFTACNSGAAKLKIQDKGSGSKIKSFS